MINLDTFSRFIGKCPCSNANGQVCEPPSSIGDNYYCESGNPMNASHQVIYIPMIHYGMASSVKVPAAMVPTLIYHLAAEILVLESELLTC